MCIIMPDCCEEIILNDDNLTQLSSESNQSNCDVDSFLSSSTTIKTEKCDSNINQDGDLIDMDEDKHDDDNENRADCVNPLENKVNCDKRVKSSNSSVLNYTIENLLKSSRKLSSSSSTTSSSSPTTAILQSTITETSLITYPAYYDYRRFLPYSNVEQVWKYIVPHHHNSNTIHSNGNGSGPIRQNRGPRRQRTTFTHEQTLRLEMEYHVAEYISRGKRFQLADLLDLTENQIKIWFQNRRAKDKRIEKAIMEQQFRHLSSSNLPKQVNLPNCSTCSYTKHQFESSMGPNVPSSIPVNCDNHQESHLAVKKHKLKIEVPTDDN